MLNFVTFIIMTLLLTNCATKFKTEVTNNPDYELTGNKIYVQVIDQNGNNISGSFAEFLKFETYSYFQKRGFTKVDLKPDAHLLVVLSPGVRDRDVYVPGQTYSTPMYQQGSQTNYNFSSTNGTMVTGTARV